MALKRQYRIVRVSHYKWHVQWSYMGLFWAYVLEPGYYHSKYEARTEAEAENYVKQLLLSQSKSAIKKVYK